MLIRMTDGSQRPITDVRVLDRVATAEGGMGTVTKLEARPTSALATVNIAGHIRFRCAPEHLLLTNRGFVAATDLVPGDLAAIPRYLPTQNDPIKPHDLAGPRLRDYRGQLAGQTTTGRVVSTITALPESVPRTAALGRLLGLYAAEGCIYRDRVVWSFGSHERETLAPETVDLLSEVFGAEARIQHRPNGSVHVVLFGRPWRYLFEVLVPGTAKYGDKRISGDAAHGPQAYLEALLDGWLAGDGHYRKRRSHAHAETTGVTVARSLALDMFAIATAIGRRPALNESQPSPNQHAATRQRRYDLSYSHGPGTGSRSAKQTEAAIWRPVRGVTVDPHDGYVLDIGVTSGHGYIADGVGVHAYEAAGQVGLDVIGDHLERVWQPRAVVPRVILNEAKVVEIRNRHAEGESVHALADEFGVTSGTIYSTVARRFWKHVA